MMAVLLPEPNKLCFLVWQTRVKNTITVFHCFQTQKKLPAPSATSESIIKAAYQLSKQERIATLEAELFNLRVKKPAPTSAIQTGAQKAKAPDVANVGKDIVPNKTKTTSRIEEIVDEEIPTQETLAPAEQSTILLEHPYRNTRDAAYVPLTTQNVGIQAKAPAIPRRSEPAYKTLPPIHDPAIANDVYKRSMNTRGA